MIFTNSYVGKLKEEFVQLENARQRWQHSIDEARNNMKQIEADVEEWMKKVETVSNNARGLLDNDVTAKKTCFCGWLPNPKERYRLGREARRTAEDVQALIARGQFGRVYYEGDPFVISSVGDRSDTVTDSRASIFQGIMKALDDEKLKVIGVYGPGGVGKTTLLEEVEKKLRKEGIPFHMIVKAKVSQSPEIKKIQDDIAYAFGLNLKDEPSEEGRRDRLFRKIQSDPSKNVLIILDDLWDKLDLKAVGIPSGDDSRGCKLLLSSRFQDVLEQNMHADQTFRLEGLNSDDAFRLFEKTVGDRLEDEEELKPIAAQVVKKLAGLPLLIISVASTLKYSQLPAWRNALIKIDVKKMETIVQLSYDHLKSKDAKSLFLLCGLIGGTIKVENLLLLGMGFGLFEGFNKTMEDARDRLNTTLDELRSACLLLDGGDDEENVVIHDLYSEVVISTPFGGQSSLMMNNNYGSWSKEKLEKCWAIRQMNVGSDRLAELMRCGFPDLKILMLSQPGDWRGRPAHQHEGDCCSLDFTFMKQLRALYLGSMHIPTLPTSIKILENLRSLFLTHCNLQDVAILGKLKALQILSFRGSDISMLPKEIGELTNLRLLSLNHCKWLQKIEPGVLKGLINLEELYIKGSFDRWLGKDEVASASSNASLAELKSLTRLTALEISIADPTVLLEDGDLPFGDLIRFWINIGNVDVREFECSRTMMLKLEDCGSILSKEWVQRMQQKAQYLHLDGLKEFNKNAHELCVQGLPQLKHLDIRNSPSIMYIASSSNDLPLTAFTILESLFLINLIHLEKIWNGPVTEDCFSKLKVVHIVKCHRLKNLWFLSEMQRLVHLEEILVRECDSLQAIITDVGGILEVAADDRVVLHNVRRLSLSYLPNMLSFCTGAEGAPIQHSASSVLSILNTYWILKLPNLKSLEINSCQSTKVVFDMEELKVMEHVEILSQLTKLTLSDLPKLQHVWKHDVKLQGLSVFLNLKQLEVRYSGLAFIFPVSVAKCLREIRDITMTCCQNMEAVIVDEDGRDGGTDDTIEFPKLKRIKIEWCPTRKFFSCRSGKKELVTPTSDSQDAYSDSFFDPKVSLPDLEELDLEKGSFKRIWHGELPRSSFCELATITLVDCSELLNVFHSTIIERLHNLKLVFILSCPSLELLFDCRSLDPNTEQTRVLLPKLERVFVEGCPSLQSLFDCTSLGSNTEQTRVLLPKLERLMIYGVEKLSHVVKSDSQTVFSFPHQTNVDVDCAQMKEVVPEEEGSRSKGVVMSFPSLTDLTLSECYNLGAFKVSTGS